MVYVVIGTVESVNTLYKMLVGVFTDQNKAVQVAKDYAAKIYPVKHLDEVLRPLSQNFSIRSPEDYKKYKVKIASGEYQRVIYHHIKD